MIGLQAPRPAAPSKKTLLASRASARSFRRPQTRAMAERDRGSAAGAADPGSTSMATTTTDAKPPPPSSSSPSLPPSSLVSKLTTVKNARDLASAAPDLLAPGLLFRSACPAGCSDDDVAVLRRDVGVRTLVDLRSDEERMHDPRCLLLHERGADVSAFDRLAGVGASPSSSSEAAGDPPTPPPLFSLGRLLGRKKRRPHSPTLPLPRIPADDPAPPGDASEPPLVVRHVSLLDKRRFREALVKEMPRASAAVVVALGLAGRVLPSSLGGGLASDASRRLAMDEINRGGLENMYACLLESSDVEIGAALRAILESLERSAPVLFFCRAGKDRTGLVAALVLSVCGVDDGRILDDYELSDDPGATSVALGGLERSKDLQGLDTSVFARAPRGAMEGALRRLRRRAGVGGGPPSSSEAVSRYLDERAGFSLAEQARLRAALAPRGKRPTPSL